MENLLNHKALEKYIVEHLNAQLLPLIARIEELESQKTPEYLTKEEVSKYLKCSISTIDNYVRRGLSKSKMSKGKVLFERSDIDHFVSDRKY